MVCNTGVSLIPTVEGTTYHFKLGGVFNGMSFLNDRETMSAWDHITGECFDGRHVGYQLTYVASLQHMTAAQATQRYPDLQLALSRPGLRQRIFANSLWRGLRLDANPGGMLPPHFPRSMDTVDPRLEQMEIGLGLWEEGLARFYPLGRLRDAGGAISDHLPTGGEQRIVVYIDPLTSTPAALYTQATDCIWDGDELRLAMNGTELGVVRDGEVQVFDADASEVSRPRQLFTRWYGFAFTFPGCSIYGE